MKKKLSVDNGPAQTVAGQELVRNGNSAADENALKPSTPPKSPRPEHGVTIVVSLRVLFNIEKEQQIYEQQGLENYIRFQVEHKTEPLNPGPAFSFVKVRQSRTSTANKELSIVHVCKTGDHIDYLKANHPNLYLSTDPTKVREALNEAQSRDRSVCVSVSYLSATARYRYRQVSLPPGIATATMFAQENLAEVSEVQLRVAFDGDAVLFSDESEQIFAAQGLEKFHEHEKENENNPMNHGPLKGFLEALGKLQKKLHAKGQRMDCPIRTYLVTTRDAASSGFRALKTLRSWDLEIDQGYFLAGSPKGPMLEEILPHIFFDDKMSHVTGAMQLGIVACHVPYGISQRETPRGPQEEALCC
ncbi:hypothetical protein NHX12_000062 [Muraenolepis orangiensis]|uniref:Cytosolic 5'-nucleotidase 1A n=1 Tax=Muraenolepis orangiensis TaxID=630683 RepID=A0A9Q0D877_9TELE|nr:hypothetical protein NHX12_000062 [Muraenolepis orangiensis]